MTTFEQPDVNEECIVDIDHHSIEFNLNELAISADLRARCPMAWNTRHGGFWMATSYAAVDQIARDGETFAHKYEPNADDGIDYQGEIGVPRVQPLPPLGIGEVDGPYHAALRRVLNPFFTRQAVSQLRPFVKECVDWFIDQRIEDGEMDLVLDLFSPVPSLVTMKMMGLPYDDWALWADFFHSTIAFAPDTEENARAVARVPEMMGQLLAFASARRQDPEEDLTSLLVLLEFDGSPLTDEEVLAILTNLVGGGVDTTTSLAAWSFKLMAEQPDLRRQLIGRPELWDTAADEFLRYTSVNQTLSRTVTNDVEVEGHTLRRSDRVLISWLAANHDEKEFERPDELLLDRSPNRHLAFGLGPHRCIGSHLAKTMFEELGRGVLERMPDHEVALDDVEEYLGDPSVTGIVKMPIRFTPGVKLGAPRPY
jgi:cytochrome P450